MNELRDDDTEFCGYRSRTFGFVYANVQSIRPETSRVYEGMGAMDQRRCSPSRFVSAVKRRISGFPDISGVSTSYVERKNLTMRMGISHITRMTHGFRKKIENLGHAVALHFMFFNFGRIDKTLRVTPAMEAVISDHVWTMEEIAGLVKAGAPKKRGPYKKKNSN